MAKQYRPIPVPEGVQLKVEPGQVVVKGKLGTLAIRLLSGLTVRTDGGRVDVEARRGIPRAEVGTFRAHLQNALVGVVQGFEKRLQVRGMGYRAQKTKDGLQVQCGFSHPVDFVAPGGITFEVNQLPNPDDTKQQMFEVVVRGIDCQAVGQIAASIRAIRTADPYKGKGVRYSDEFIRKKAGKRAIGTQA